MFGLFKKEDDKGAIKLKNDFEQTLREVKAVEREKQALVGRGIKEAEKSFLKTYSKASFQAARFDEQMKQINFIRAMEVRINGMEGPMRIMAIGYAMFNRWQAAVMTSDAALIRQFEHELENLKKIADSYS
jgi:hypothetical protein